MTDQKEYYMDRLAEPWLLDKAIAVPTGPGDIGLAVPVGTIRRGGELEIEGEQKYAVNALKLLQSHPGFPDLRIDVCYDDDGKAFPNYFVLLWGDRAPFGGCDYMEPVCAVAIGLYHGYKHEAIADMFEQYARCPRRRYTKKEISELILSAAHPSAGLR